ncbi:MAG: hypothetical protein HRU25_07060 [Psychrobium sp.]|nr:hypothetical protein [Psychrobium sp.]
MVEAQQQATIFNKIVSLGYIQSIAVDEMFNQVERVLTVSFYTRATS